MLVCTQKLFFLFCFQRHLCSSIQLFRVLLSVLFCQYVAKTNSELHQRAIPKQTQVANIDERDDSIERHVERIPLVNPVQQPEDVTSNPQPEFSILKPTTENVAAQKVPVARTTTNPDEIPHVQVETENTRQARRDRQWLQIKFDVSELPDIYARLSKIKLTGI